MKGKISNVRHDKGFGFLRDEQGLSRFFRVRDVLPVMDFDLLNVEDAVTFEPLEIKDGIKGNGLRAKKIVRAS